MTKFPDQLLLRSDVLGDLARRWSTVAPDHGLDSAIDASVLEALADANAGTPYAFEEQYRGQLVQDIRPKRGHEHESSSRGRTPLRLHTDDAFLDASARPQYLALAALANVDGIPTVVVTLDDVLEALSSATIEALSEPSFQSAPPASFGNLCTDVGLSPPRPVLREGGDGCFEVALSTQVWPVSTRERDADGPVQAFRAAADRAPRVEVRLKAGEILVISNSRLLHGRPAVPHQRVMKRVYLRRGFVALDAAACPGRPRVYGARKVLQRARRRPSAW